MQNNGQNQNWVKRGLIWGAFMFLGLAILFPLAEGDNLFIGRLLIKLIIWLILGLGYGYFIHEIGSAKKSDRKE